MSYRAFSHSMSQFLPGIREARRDLFNKSINPSFFQRGRSGTSESLPLKKGV
jgi:hypothetical protein